MHTGHDEEVLGKVAAGMVFDVVVGLVTGGSDTLLVDESIDQQGVALVGLGAVGKPTPGFARQGRGALGLALHQGADLRQQPAFVE